MNTAMHSRHQQPGTAGTSGRIGGGSSTANTYEYASNMGGYQPENPRLTMGSNSALGGHPTE